MASIRAVESSPFFAFTSAPALTKRRTIASSPLRAAHMSAVRPPLGKSARMLRFVSSETRARRFGSAPAASNASTTGRCPSATAHINAV
jgi:hypothetical protein